MFGSTGKYKVTEWTKAAESSILFGCREGRMAGEELHDRLKMLMMSGGKKKEQSRKNI